MPRVLALGDCGPASEHLRANGYELLRAPGKSRAVGLVRDLLPEVVLVGAGDDPAAAEALVGQVTGDPIPLWAGSMHYWRHERHRHPAFLPAYQHLREGRTPLHLVKTFDAGFLNRDLYRRLDPMFAGYFISPTVEFYARNESAPPQG